MKTASNNIISRIILFFRFSPNAQADNINLRSYGYRINVSLLIIAMLSVCPVCTSAVQAEEDNSTPVAESSDRTAQYEMLKKSIETTLKDEKALEAKRVSSEEEKQALLAELNSFKIQLSTYGNMLLSPQTRIEKIVQAWADHQADQAVIAEKLKKLKIQRDEINRLRLQTDEQFTLSQKQLHEINTDVPNIAEIQTLVERMQKRIRILVRILGHHEYLLENYDLLIKKMESTHTAFTALSSKFQRQIEERKKQALFERQEQFSISMLGKQIKNEADLLFRQIVRAFTVDFWRNSGVLHIRNFSHLISCMLLFGVSQLLLRRFQKYWVAKLQKGAIPAPWRSFAFELFLRSLLLCGALLFFYIYTHIRNLHTTIPIIQPLLRIMICWQFTQWILDFLKSGKQRQLNIAPGILHSRLIWLILLIRTSVIIYVMMAWVIGNNGTLPQCLRILFLAGIILWTIRFWIVFQKTDPDAIAVARHLQGFFRKFRKNAVAAQIPLRHQITENYRVYLKTVLFGLGDIIIGGSLLLEIAGYGSLSLYWLTSWGQSMAVLLWSGLIFMVLYEWNGLMNSSPQLVADTPVQPAAASIKWLMIRIGWPLWLIASVAALLFAWGAKGPMLVGLLTVLNTTFAVGGLKLSISGFIYAGLVLLFVHVTVRLWQHTVSAKFLTGSGLNRGVQNSIKHLVAYLVWLFGILMALNVAGINATSLTVIFGAVGIGLGLGLQNIFNNFVSGLILHFERPVKVDDIVEINNTWGEIRKIKFRSTLVQTYDNAALIIPNSQILSERVTNWSFKDTRVRRHISIGVAYGSDVQSVKTTLLEIAAANREVLKHPKPEVLFTDFGDSALMFKLRFWCDVETFITAETEMRFEIDRLFREREITIPFPQRDVHLN
ncbi:mechanosensitive ion channel [Desulfococcaceae bacterium HSG7]|nr:mechanosensitive ion channel [Desulfococcaceae bacterium HSG7]